MKTGEENRLADRRAPEGGLRDFLTVLFKHKIKIATAFLLCLLAGLSLSFLVPPLYEAKSTVLVKMGREHVSNPGAGDTRLLLSLEQQEILNSEIQILNNRELTEKVVTLLKAETLYPKLANKPPSDMSPREASILRLEKHLSVVGVRKSNVIEVSFRHEDPTVAAKVVNLLIELYREKLPRCLQRPPVVLPGKAAPGLPGQAG